VRHAPPRDQRRGGRTLLTAALLLPGLYWDHGVETAPALRRAGVDCIHTPPARLASWEKAGFCAHPASLEGRVKLPPPGVRWEINEATATRAPWVDSNGWRLLRAPGARFFYSQLPAGKAALAAAEAFAYGADAWLQVQPADLEAFAKMLVWLKALEAPPLAPRANIALYDDGSDLTGEVMNLLSRRNLLYRVVSAPDASADLNVRIGSKQHPKSDAANPSTFAQKLRAELGDARRLARLFGSEVVLARLAGDAARARLHLLNYGGEPVEGLRVRLLGAYSKVMLVVDGRERAAAEELEVSARSTEFTAPAMGIYVVADLER